METKLKRFWNSFKEKMEAFIKNTERSDRWIIMTGSIFLFVIDLLTYMTHHEIIKSILFSSILPIVYMVSMFLIFTSNKEKGGRK